MQQLIDFKDKEVNYKRILQYLKKNTPRFAKLQPKRPPGDFVNRHLKKSIL